MNKHFADVAPDDCPAEIPRTQGAATLTGAWTYPAVGKTPPLLKVRYDGADGKKDMRWWHAVAGDAWEIKLAGHAPGLYGVGSIRPGESCFVVEGEKAAAALHSIGVSAVGLPGAASAASVDLSPLDGKDVILWPDRDKPGANAMDAISERLPRMHRRVDPAALDLPEKGDAADLIGGPDTLLDGDGLMAWIAPALVDVAAPPPPEPMGQHLPDGWFTADIPPREFVFQGALPLDAVSLLVATGGTGKSMLSLELAASAATGRALLPCFEPTTAPSGVAVLALEDDIQEIQRRLQRVGRAFGLDYDNRDVLAVARNVRFFCLPAFAVCGVASDGMLAESPDLKRLAAELAEFRPRLVIADPLAGLLGGVVEEGSNEAAQAVIGLLRSAMPTGTAMLVCAHTSKAERLLSTTARGASAWMDAARQVLALRPPDTGDTRTLGDDARLTVVLEMTKSNYSALTPPVYLRRCTLPDFAGVLKPFDFAECKRQAAQARTAGIADAVLLMLPDFPVTFQEVKGDVKTDDAKERGRAFREALDTRFDTPVKKCNLLVCLKAMLEDGRIVKRKDDKRDVLVAVPATETDEESPL